MKNIGRQAKATAIITGISKLSAAGATVIPAGAISPQRPSTARILKILLPTTLPTAISRSPRTAATTEVATSGNEVPAAMRVRPEWHFLSYD